MPFCNIYVETNLGTHSFARDLSRSPPYRELITSLCHTTRRAEIFVMSRFADSVHTLPLRLRIPVSTTSYHYILTDTVAAKKVSISLAHLGSDVLCIRAH